MWQMVPGMIFILRPKVMNIIFFRKSFFYCFLGLALLAFVYSAAGNQLQNDRTEIISALKELSDEQLGNRLHGLLEKDLFRHEPDYEPSLQEIIHRGGEHWKVFLQKELDMLTARKFKLYEGSEDFNPGTVYNLELLTALRRVEGKPDPLRIFIHSRVPLVFQPTSLPSLTVTIRNVDVDRKDVGFTSGGDYRSGRQARWRLSMTDSKGSIPHDRAHVGFIVFGGGLYSEDILKFEEEWKTELQMRDFVENLRPGLYCLDVLYHNTETIADYSDISGLIISRSAPITLIVQPTVIKLTESEKQSAQKWIALLDATKPVKVVAGSYGPWAHMFVSLDSPEGKLLEMGLKAAPQLIEELQKDTISDEKRAWIFSLLFSITGENDPRRGDVLANFYEINGPWQVWGGPPGKERLSGGIGFPSQGWGWRGKIDQKEQKQMTAKWVEWIKSVNVIEVSNHQEECCVLRQSRMPTCSFSCPKAALRGFPLPRLSKSRLFTLRHAIVR